MRHLLALDAGTGSGRAVVFDENGLELASASREWRHVSIPEYPGSMTFDMGKNWRLLCDCIKEACSKVSNLEISAVSTTSMREGIAVYDKNRKELWACANVDARAVEQVKRLRSEDTGLEKEIYGKSGQTFALGAVPRLLWLKEKRPDIYDQAAYVVMLSDWIAFRLGAELAVDPSNGGTTGLFDLTTRKWDKNIAELCGVKQELLNAPVYEAGTPIGTVSSIASEDTGLQKGIPVVMGGGDAQLGSVGVGAVTSGDAAVFGGTFWQQEINLSKPVYDKEGRIRINFHSVPDLWQAEAIVFFPGLIVRWFRDAMCPDIKLKALGLGVDPYVLLDEGASSVKPGSNGIIPIFSDAMNYSHWRHAAPSLLNLSIDPEVCSREAIFRSLLENAAIVTYANLKMISELTGSFPSEVIFAGGASKSPLWCQILSDVVQIPVKTRVVKEATALGAAICAAKGVGIIDDISTDGIKYIKEDKIYYPDKKNKQVYQDLYKMWRDAYKNQLDLSDRGLTTSMWKAPGE